MAGKPVRQRLHPLKFLALKLLPAPRFDELDPCLDPERSASDDLISCSQGLSPRRCVRAPQPRQPVILRLCRACLRCWPAYAGGQRCWELTREMRTGPEKSALPQLQLYDEVICLADSASEPIAFPGCRADRGSLTVRSKRVWSPDFRCLAN